MLCILSYNSYCQSNLIREAGYGRAAEKAMNAVARPAEVGARTVVHGACAESGAHGQYLADCEVKCVGGHAKEGEKSTHLQKRVWEELRIKLEVIRPGLIRLP